MPIEMDGETYYSAEEAASYLGVTRHTLNMMIKDGRLTRYKRGVTRNIYFSKTQLDRLNKIQPVEDNE